MTKQRRWKLMDKILFISFGLIILFAWFDSENLIGMKEIDRQWQAAGGWSPTSNVWLIFWETISPAVFGMWMGVLIAIGLIWYLYSKDKSEALALFLTPAILIWFGVQDVIYFIFSPDVMVETIGCWADLILPVKIVSDILGEACPTYMSFMVSAFIGVYIAYKSYNYLKRSKW